MGEKQRLLIRQRTAEEKLKIAGTDLLFENQGAKLSKLQNEEGLKLIKISDEQLKSIENKLLFDSDYDLLLLDSESVDMARLIKKGYAQRLESQKLNEHIAKMQDFLKNYAGENGENYCLPINYQINFEALNLDAVKKFGEKIPTTYAEYYSLLARLSKSIDGRYSLFDEPFDANMAINGLLEEAMQESLLTKGKIELDTAYLKQGIEAVLKNSKALSDALKLVEKGEISVLENGDLELIGKRGIFSSYDFDTDERLEPVILKNNPESKGFLAARVGFFIVNPRSKNKEAAFRFLEKIIDMQSETERFSLMKGESRVIENAEIVKELEGELNTLNERLKNQTNTIAVKELEKEIEQLKQRLEMERYIVSPRDVERLAKLLSLNPTAVRNFSKLHENTYKKTGMLVSGKISIEAYIKELQSVINLMELEGK